MKSGTMSLLILFYTFMTALSSALIMVPFLRRWALEQGATDQPDERKLHDRPMPRLGGIAIFLSFLFAILIFSPVNSALRGILAGCLVVFVTGLADDLYDLSPCRKLFGQVVACLITIAVAQIWLYDLGDLFGMGRILLPSWLGIPFTVFSVVGVCNAVNLIDGLDGLAGGITVLALGVFLFLSLQDNNVLVAVVATALAGALFGFLKYNFYPARIFMGDAGSLMAGFLLAFLSIHLTQRSGATVSPMLPVLVLGLPLLDALWVTARRLLHGQNPFAPDRSHLHHRFLTLGFEHRLTVLIIYSISLFWACSALVLHNFPEYLLVAYLGISATVFNLGLQQLSRYRNRYSLLQRDAQTGWRDSVIFGRAADLVDRLLPVLSLLLGGYALLAIAVVLQTGNPAWPVALLLFAGGLMLRFVITDGGGEFSLLLVYLSACLCAFAVWQSEGAWAAGFSAKRLGDFLLAMASVLVALKLLFRRRGEFFLATADYLALTLTVVLTVATQQTALGLAYAGPLMRAILLMLALRTMASRGPAFGRMLINMALALLALFACAGLA